MDAQTFDRLVMEEVRRSTRRTILRLLAAGMLGALLSQRGVTPARAAQRLDSDQDGLYDDDETNVYGTDPDNPDTDGDGVGDGEEVYVGTDPLAPDGSAASAACPAGQVDCGASCIDITSDALNCGGCDIFCDTVIGPICVNGVCTADPATSTCRILGARCTSDAECCNTAQNTILCCFNGTVLDTICTDTAPTGFVCPGIDPPNPPTYEGCPAGQSNCGGNCVDTRSHAGHCGLCFASCPLGGVCRDAVCTAL